MDNISKALIMISSVFFGVLILGLAVYVFQLYGNYTSENYKALEKNQISQFNSQFLKYYGNISNSEGKIEPIKCTAHDIISVANLAKQNNTKYQLTEYNENTYYIQVDIGSKKEQINLENWNENQKIQFIKDNSIINDNIKYFKCTNIRISDITTRVCYIKFEEI